MIHFDNNGILVQSPSDLPQLPDEITELFADFETTSGSPKLDSLNPWHHCSIAGLAFTWDNEPKAWYVEDTPWARVFIKDMFSRAKRWVNHNIKYDAHVYENNIGGLPDRLELWCTQVSAKIIDSDRTFTGGYGLDALSLAWLKEDISYYEERLKPYLYRNKDYGSIPVDICGEYACQDVLTNRRLHRCIESRVPDQCLGVLHTERELTRVLFEIEQTGLAVNMQELKIKEFLILKQLCMIEEQLEKIVGFSFRPHVNPDCYEVMCGKYGLPVVAYTDSGEPSFDKHAMATFIGHPHAPQEVVHGIIQYRSLNTLLGFFVKPYQNLQVDGILHSMYNQMVRTGRLSSKWPNSQQLSKSAKELIHPRPGNAFLSCDYAQIEFRFIVHYIQDADAIEAYEKDPDTDFHNWVADMCDISRRPAKTVNFMIGYGGGKKRTVSTLSSNGEVIADVDKQLRELIEGGLLTMEDYESAFKLACEERALAVYNRYHETLPGLKRTARKAGAKAAHRGFVYNLYGRHRHLPQSHAHKAFNTLCQSSAADLLKERTVAVHKMLKNTPIKIVASVHDETLFEGPEDVIRDPRTMRDVVACLESPSVKLRVPVRCSAGVSSLHWREAGGDEVATTMPYGGDSGHLDHAKMVSI